jgi:ferredoxin
MFVFLQAALILIGVFLVVIAAGFGIVSWKEGEKRARQVSITFAIVAAVLFSIMLLLPDVVQVIFLSLLIILGLALTVLFLLPIGKITLTKEIPSSRVDERDIPFARVRLKPGSPEHKAYYSAHPENEAVDDRFRSKPGLLSLESKMANPYLFASAEGSFALTEGLRDSVDGPVSNTRYSLPVDEITAYVKSLALYYGALEVGICELKPYHYYSHIGRGSGTYGDSIQVEHTYGIAFTVEMDFKMVGASPGPPVVMESGRQYVEAARIAVQLAAAVRYLGYPARAHIDGNYRVIAPLVGRDAGLGEIGRMGILMTPRQGPRVRIGVVTTNLELVPDVYQPYPAVIDFCTICKKCAENCPSKSIPFDGRREIDGARRWQIDSDSCFLYWNVVGTDCAKCMAVCPYSHLDTFSHNLIRSGITRSGVFRRGALWMNDLFYGKRPAGRYGLGWTKVNDRR